MSPSLNPHTEHARYVYDLQDSDQTDEEDHEDEYEDDSDDGARRRGRSRRVTRAGKRMSILTSKYFDVPRPPPEFERAADDGGDDSVCGAPRAPRKRRFFESGAEWDPVRRVVAERAGAGVRAFAPGFGVGALGIVGAFEADPAWVSVVDPDVRGEDGDEEGGEEMDEDED